MPSTSALLAVPCYLFCVAALRRACQNLIFRFLQSKQRISVWLYENTELRIEGRIIGFDEYMNIVLDDAEEVLLKKKTRKAVGVSHCSVGSLLACSTCDGSAQRP